MKNYKIGEIAKLAQVNIETIRFYERKDLISPVRRLESGYRLFSDETVKRIKFIKHAKYLGFTLREIHEILNLGISDQVSCDIMKENTRKKLNEIESKINILTQMKDILEDLLLACETKRMTEDCPILRMMDSED